MDVSPEYIEMCEKSEEIQELVEREDTFSQLLREIPPTKEGKGKNVLVGHNVFYRKHKIYRKKGKGFYTTILVGGDKQAIKRELNNSNCGSLETPYYVWLPRQDQLQEMVSSDYWVCWNGLHEYVHRMMYPLGLTSMEQLWLAFVMKEKYEKVWQNGEWVEAP